MRRGSNAGAFRTLFQGSVAAAVVLSAVAAHAEQPAAAPPPPELATASSKYAQVADASATAPRTGDDAPAEEFTLLPTAARPSTTSPAAMPAETAGADVREPFDKGTWSLQLTGSYYDNFSGKDVTLAYATASLGYYFADHWAVDFSLSGYGLEEDGESEGVAGSFGVNLRSHFLVRDPFSLYLDGGTGLFRADGRFPSGGTNTNFTLQAGLGATYRLTESMHLVGGARWFHISNARRYGKDRNASTDGTAVYLGVMFTW